MRGRQARTLAFAVAAVAAHRLGRPADSPEPVVVSERTGARLLFPDLSSVEASSARIRITDEAGVALEWLPDGAGGHVLAAKARDLGIADPVALDALWSELRLARELRPLDAAEPEAAARLEVEFPGGRHVLRVGGATPDGAGRYGSWDGTSAVLDAQLATLLRADPAPWLLRRLAAVDVADVVAITWFGADGTNEQAAPSLTLHRGDDGPWRSAEGAWWAASLVEARVERLLATPTQLGAPEAQPDSVPGGVELGLADGRKLTWRRVGRCSRQGEGAAGALLRPPRGADVCVAQDRLTPPALQEFGEPRLAPWALARVLEVDALMEPRRRLRRSRGEFVLVETVAGREVEQAVAGAQVQRWWGDLQAIEVSPLPPQGSPPRVTHRVRVRTDAGTEHKIECGLLGAGPLACRRTDAEGSGAWVVGRAMDGAPELARLELDGGRLADHRVVVLQTADVTALELSDAGGLRQSARLDLGVWRLDAPAHPEGDGALDEVRLEAYLHALASARAESFGTAPAREPDRTITVHPRGGGAAELIVGRLWRRECTLELGRVARLDPETCRALGEDLLYDDPLRSVLAKGGRAERVGGGSPTVLTRDGEDWRGPDGIDAGDDLAEIDAFRAAGLAPESVEVAGRTWRVVDEAGIARLIELGTDVACVGPPRVCYRRRR